MNGPASRLAFPGRGAVALEVSTPLPTSHCRARAAAPVTVVGQGLAGSWLAWYLEQAGRDFVIYDPGRGEAAALVGAGLVNPLTGRRWVPTWRFAEDAAGAAADYDAVGTVLGQTVRRDLSLWRRWRDASERSWVLARRDQPQRAQWLGRDEAAGIWINGAWQVDLPAWLAGLRARWRQQGRLREAAFTPAEAAATPGPVIWTVGAGVAELCPGVPWRGAAGEVLTGTLPAGAPDEGRLDGEWVLPMPGGGVRVGATYRPDDWNRETTSAGRERLQAAARRLTGQELRIEAQLAGVRVTTPDKRPVAGWLPGREGREGVLGGLGSKGVLWAPRLARRWVEHWRDGRPLVAATDPARFGGGRG